MGCCPARLAWMITGSSRANGMQMAIRTVGHIARSGHGELGGQKIGL